MIYHVTYHMSIDVLYAVDPNKTSGGRYLETHNRSWGSEKETFWEWNGKESLFEQANFLYFFSLSELNQPANKKTKQKKTKNGRSDDMIIWSSAQYITEF